MPIIKGDEMKRTEITYVVRGSNVEIRKIENAISWIDIVKMLGKTIAFQYLQGPFFYRVNDGYGFYVRLGNRVKDSNPTFVIREGMRIPEKDFNTYIKIMKKAGERLSNIINTEQTVKI